MHTRRDVVNIRGHNGGGVCNVRQGLHLGGWDRQRGRGCTRLTRQPHKSTSTHTAPSPSPSPSHLEVRCEGVGQAHVAGEGTEYEVAHLDAVGRDDVAEGEVVLTEELGEVVQQNQQHPQRALQGRAEQRRSIASHMRTCIHTHARTHHAHTCTLYKSCVALPRSAFLKKGERKVKRSMSSNWNSGHPWGGGGGGGQCMRGPRQLAPCAVLPSVAVSAPRGARQIFCGR